MNPPEMRFLKRQISRAKAGEMKAVAGRPLPFALTQRWRILEEGGRIRQGRNCLRKLMELGETGDHPHSRHDHNLSHAVGDGVHILAGDQFCLRREYQSDAGIVLDLFRADFAQAIETLDLDWNWALDGRVAARSVVLVEGAKDDLCSLREASTD